MKLFGGTSPPGNGRARLVRIVRMAIGFCLAALIVTPLLAADARKGDTKAPPEVAANAPPFVFPEKIKLDKSQQAKLDAMRKKYAPQLQELNARASKILTPSRVLASAVAREAAAADHKEGKALDEAARNALNLTPEEDQKLQKIDEERNALRARIREEKQALLTAAQRDQLIEKPATGFFLQFAQKLFQPLLLFFYLGFLIPLFKVPYEFPRQIYQGITLYLLVAIGWHGGEELARMTGSGFAEALGFMIIGFGLNILISIIAYNMLRLMTRMRRIDAATVGGYYGSDSAGTFLTCVGVLMVMGYRDVGYMPVLLAVMETPGCLVCLYQIARLRRSGMDRHGNMPDELGYEGPAGQAVAVEEEALVAAGAGGTAAAVRGAAHTTHAATHHDEGNSHGPANRPRGLLSWEIIHEVFFNPGLYFLFGGIIIGLVAGKLFIPYHKEAVIASENLLFVTLMHGILCLFLLEMGISACNRLRDLKSAGPGFIVFGILAPNLFAVMGITAAHMYSIALGQPFPIPYYALFAVLCAAASYIAVPAVQRMAIPEASPTLPLAASLGLTFTWNVTLGIPIYITIAELFIRYWPVAGTAVS